MIVGLFLKHIKAYKGINFAPIGLKYKFVSYVGENGVGKSSILEALDSFFNSKPYPINKSALSDSISTVGNEPFISPIFVIEKSRVTRQKKEFEKVSLFFWNVKKRIYIVVFEHQWLDFLILEMSSILILHIPAILII
ncbi:AAA family ATPase [Shewanella woodyi]|uniref:AAA family ATPase n=1 Tax=Shewanella woodyi TaxID=60961 RepID=UPI003748002D